MKMKKAMALFLTVVMLIPILAACSSASSPAASAAPSAGPAPSAPSPSPANGTKKLAMEIKCGTPPPENVNFVRLMSSYFFPELEKQSGGQYVGKIYPNSQLAGGDQPTEVNMVQQGSIEMGILGSGPIGSFVKDLPYTAMPFLFKDHAEVDKVFSMDSEAGKYLGKLHEQAGFKLLGVVENGFKQVTNSKRQLYAPSDASGIKIRVSSNPILADCWKSVGANPTTFNISEAYSAFQQGILDGQENAFCTTIIPNKFYEVQKYITVANYAYEIFLMVFNLNQWSAVDEASQSLFFDLAEKVIADAKAADRASEADAQKFVKDYGCDVHEWTDQDKTVWKSAFQATMDKYRATYDQGLVAAIENSK